MTQQKEGFLPDLFMGLGNTRWELARVSGGFAIFTFGLSEMGVVIRFLIVGGEMPDFTAMGLGFASVMGGAAALIFAKDTARTNAISQSAKDANEATSAATPDIKVAGDIQKADVAGNIHVAGEIKDA